MPKPPDTPARRAPEHFRAQKPGSLLTTPEDSILKSFLSLGGGELLARAVAFVGTAFLARKLGSYGFGVIGFATAIFGYVSIALYTGFGPIGSREVARDPQRAPSLAAGVGALRLLFAVVLLGLIGLLTAFLDKPPEVELVLLLTSLGFFPLAIGTRWVYKGLGRNRWVGTSLVLAQIVYVAALLVAVRSPDDVYRVPLAQVLGESVAAAYLLFPLLGESSWKIDFAGAWKVLRASGYLIVSGLLGALVRILDIVLISLLLGETQVGLYSAAYRFCFLVMAVGIALQTAYLPALSRSAQRGARQTSAVVDRALESAASLALPMVAGGWILAEPLLGRLFGAEYAAAGGAFRLLLAGMGFFYLHGILYRVEVAYDRTRVETLIRGVAALVSAALNLLLIPRYGIAGAAFATLVADGLITGARWVVCWQLGIRIRLAPLAKPAIASAGMAAAMLLAGWRLPWFGLFLVGAIAYLVILALLRGLPRDLRP